MNMKQNTIVQQEKSNKSHRVEVLWGYFLTGLSFVFFVVFLLNMMGVIRLYRSYIETEGQILARQPVEVVSATGVTQQLYRCRVAYDEYFTDDALCYPSIVTNTEIRMVYSKNNPLQVYCGAKKPSFFGVIRMYSTSYFWILVGWLSPSFLVIGLSVLYEEIYIKKATTAHSE